MKYFPILFVFITACEHPASPKIVTPAPVIIREVIYDTLETEAHAFRVKYTLPSEYEICRDTARGGWVVKYQFANLHDPAYLYECWIGITIMWLEPDATLFKRPSDAVACIKRHYATVLADRASHHK